MKILHTYCLNYNLGDYALGIGVKNLLRHYLEVDLIAETNLQGTIFTDYFVNEVVNKRYDLLVIGGGGIIHGPHWPNGWFWLIEEQDISKIRVPFIVYGVGYNYFKGEPGVPKHGVEHLKETIRNATYFSLRNDGSLERLRDQTGISLPEIPDPGFYVGLDTSYDKPVDEDYVIIQLANDKAAYRFGNHSSKKVFTQNLKKVVNRLIKDFKVIFAPHVFEDIELSYEVASGLTNCEVWDFSRYAFDHARDAIAYYKYAEFVLAMRGHGQILPIAFNVPVISLENHEKNQGLMQKLGLLQYNINILDPEFVIKCNALIDNICNNRQEISSLYLKLNKIMEENTKNAFSEIIMKLKAH